MTNLRYFELFQSEDDEHVAPFQDAVDYFLNLKTCDESQVLHLKTEVRALHGVTPSTQDVRAQSLVISAHSGLSFYWLSSVWRIQEIVGSFVDTARQNQIIPCASATRMLIETYAFLLEDSRRIHEVWGAALTRDIETLDDAKEFADALRGILDPALFGTRIPEMSEGLMKKKNVMTLLEKLEKNLPQGEWERRYGYLSDFVHPALGTYLSRLEVPEQDGWSSFHVAKRKTKTAGGLTYHLIGAAGFATILLKGILEDLWSLVCDISLRFQLGKIQGWRAAQGTISYFGLVDARSPYEPCVCGSGRKTRFCSHPPFKIVT